MNKVVAILISLLTILMVGPMEAQTVSASCDEAGSCCCCGDALRVDPCVCADDGGIEFPEIAVAGGPLLTPLVPPPEDHRVRLTHISEVCVRWHPALPWHAPPAERRARLSVWNL